MKAVIRSQYGPPEFLSIEERPIPIPKANEILIKVKFTTVNRTDCGILWGEPWIIRLFTGLRKPKDVTPGTDFSGTVEAVGAEVTEFKKGDKVWGFDDGGLQTQSQYVVVPRQKPIMRIPEKLSFEAAAASAEGAHYAYNFIKPLNIKSGSKVLVNGGTGAIGSAAIQFLKFFNTHVTVVCPGEHFEKITALGADKLIDYLNEDFTRLNEKYDFVFDAVGKSRYKLCKRILTENGTYLSSELGPRSENIFLALKSKLSRDKRVIFPVPTDIKGSLSFIQERLFDNTFRPLLDKIYPLEEIRDAYHYVRSENKIGNVLVSFE